MNRIEKEAIVAQLTDEFSKAGAVVVCDYKGMSVKELEAFRKVARGADVNVRVIKNTLASIALKNAEKDGMTLVDTNIYVWGEDLVSLTKTVVNFAKNQEKLVIKTGFVDGEVADPAKIEAYSKLPGREELLGMLLSTWVAPIRNLLYVWSGPQRNLVNVLHNLSEEKK